MKKFKYLKISNTKKNILIDHIREGGSLLAIIGPNADNDTYTTILKSLGVNDFSIGAMKQGDYLLKIENELVNSEIIKKIEVYGNERLAKETIILFSELNVNDNIYSNDLNNAFKKLYL